MFPVVLPGGVLIDDGFHHNGFAGSRDIIQVHPGISKMILCTRDPS